MVTVEDLPPAPPRQDDDEPTAEVGQVKQDDFIIASTWFLLQEDNAAVLPPASPPPVDVLQPESQFAAELDAEQVSSCDCNVDQCIMNSASQRLYLLYRFNSCISPLPRR